MQTRIDERSRRNVRSNQLYKIDSNNINKTLDGRDWAYVEDKAINSDRLTEAHYIKGKIILHIVEMVGR